ncbi:MAG: AAA family ATPase [archaeon]|nr:AAA family ATPase [archaeon]
MFDRNSRVIKDGRKLSFDYVPETLVCRDRQMKNLEHIFKPLALDGRPCNAILVGGVGSGKTVTAKRFCMDMAEYFSQNNRRITYQYINCRLRNTEYAVILDIMRNFDRGFPDRGFSSEELLASIKRHIVTEDAPYVIVLDEADVLLKNNSKNLIYQLTRFSDDMVGNASLSLILISQVPLNGLVDEASLSTFKRTNLVTFDRYSFQELKEIVEFRASLALEDGVLSDGCSELIAKFAEEYGDARLAIEVLEKASLRAEDGSEGCITLDDVRTAGASIYSDASESKIDGLDTNRKLVLLAVCRAMKDNLTIPMKNAEKTYAVVCEEYDYIAKKHTQFYSYLQGLERDGFIVTEVKREVNGGRATHISIQNIPPKELAAVIESKLDSESPEERL